MKIKLLFLFASIFTLFSPLTVTAQMTVGSTEVPASGALLQLKDINGVTDDGKNSNRGFQLPRVTLTDVNNLYPMFLSDPNNPASAPSSDYSGANKAAMDKTHKGLVVYNISSTAPFTQGVYVWDGAKWNNVTLSEPWRVSGTTNEASQNTQNIYQMGRVGIGIGYPDTIPAITMLNVVANNKGIMIPRLTKVQRDAIPVDSLANSLLIYNTTEDCYNYYSKSEGEWQSLCGKVGKAAIDSVVCNSVQVFGSYIKGVPTTINERLVIPIEVTKPGAWEATATAMYDATTANGYTFTGSGTFLFTGPQTITLTAQGTPTQAHYSATPPPVGDNVKIKINGTDYVCNGFIIPVTPAAANYNVLCGSAKVYGVYTLLPDQTNSDDATHYIEVNVDVIDTQGGLATGWSAETNKVSGLQFRGSGSFNVTGSQSIRLYAVAGSKPTSLDPIVLTMTFQTKNGEMQCQITVRAAYTPKKIVVFGLLGTTMGYNLQVTSTSSYKFMESPYNFGSLDNSTVKMITNFTAPSGYTKVGAFAMRWEGGARVNVTAAWDSIMKQKPDIVILTYEAPALTLTYARRMVEYLNAGGIVLDFQEDNISLLIAEIFGMNASSIGCARRGTGAYCTLANYTDPILNGPFQPAGLKTLGGLDLGGDYETTLYGISGLPASGVLIYAYNNDKNYVSAFRALGQRFCYFGDGGFFSNNNNQSWTTDQEPFATTRDFNSADVTYRPAMRPIQTLNTQYPNGAYNSFYWGNMLNWAINEAQFYGINSGN